MLPRKHRLTQDKDFKKIFKKGKFFIGRFINLRIAKNNLEVSRFGFIVGKKKFKKAVDRNKIKRQLREIIHLKLDKIKSGFDIAIIVKEDIKNKSYQEIDGVMEKVLNKAGLLNKN